MTLEHVGEQPIWRAETIETYVGFADILGFSHRIETDFHTAVDTYRVFLDRIRTIHDVHADVPVQIYSDSILLTSANLIHLAQAVQNLCFVALTADCLVRGGIGFGKHAVQIDGANTLVVSQALSRAVEMERRVRHPCVAFHESVILEDWVWVNDSDTFFRPILYFEGIRLVNPFSLFWGTSAQYKVQEMREAHPEHADKYDWFLRLFDAVSSRDIWSLVPPEFAQYYERVGGRDA